MPLDVDATAVSACWWRHVPDGGAIWFRSPHAADGRWQRGELVEGFYLADSPATAWAEWYRMLAEYALRPTVGMPRDLWRLQVELPRAADLRTAERLARVGLAVPRPGTADWASFQRVGGQLWAEGWPALLAPSAARPADGTVLCVFRTSDTVPGLTPLPPPEIHLEPPPPPRGLRT